MANPFLDADTPTANPFLDAAPTTTKKTSFGKDFIEGEKAGVGAAGDLFTGNFAHMSSDAGSNIPSPKTEALEDKLFPKGSGGSGPAKAAEELYSNIKNTNGWDYLEALNEKAGQSAPGKALTAIGAIPEMNAAGTLVNRNVVPKIAKITGMTEEHVKDLLPLTSVLGIKGAGKIPTEKTIPLTAGTVRKATNIISHPLDNATKAVESASKFVKPAVQKIERARLDSGNSLVGGGLKTSMESQTAKEGATLGKKLGVKFSAGELTGNASAMGIEDALANSAKYAGRFAAENEKKTNMVVDNFKKTLDKIYPQSVSRVDVGSKISEAYKSTIDNLVSSRRNQAKVDFELANKVAGGHPIIAPSNFITVLKKFIAEGDSNITTPAQRAAANQAKDVLKRLQTETPKPSGLLDETGQPLKHPTPKEAYKRITIDDLQNGLAAFGEGATSPNGGIWKGLSTAADRRFSAAAKAALEKDMDGAADTIGGSAATALKIARDRYRVNSARISDVEKTTLGKIVGGAEHDSEGNLVISPEKMADKFLAMEPTEIKNTLKFLDKTHPDVAAMGRRYSLEVALHKALEGKGQRGEGASKPFPKAKFVESLPGDDKLDAILGGSGSARNVRDVASALNRMVDWGASKKGSQTVQRTNILESLAHWGKGAIYRSLASDALVDDLLDPTKREELAKDAKKVNQQP